MYSFYGGQPGIPFVIITTYRSITDMVNKFKLGSGYTAVHYDQYVMINTVNKNDPDNGKIYRRGYDFNNNMGGAEFVGTIVGPSGNSPTVQLTTIAEVRRKAASPVQGYSVTTSSGTYSPSGENLIPGKTISDNFNDAIRWECCSIRNENNEDTTAYIGFIFPYLVVDVEADSVSPYINNRIENVAAAYRTDDYTHPFYEKWHFDIPKGIKGDSFKNLKIQVADNSIQPYQNQTVDINNRNKVLVYEYYNYDSSSTGNPKKLYLGSVNSIIQSMINVYTDSTATNLQWSGLGTLTNSNSGQYMTISFTMPLTQLLSSNIDGINITSGKLYVSSQQSTYNLNNFIINSSNTTITKTLSGLKFQIQTTFENLNPATVKIISILVNQLNLQFTTTQSTPQ